MKNSLSARKRIIYWSVGLLAVVITILCTTSLLAVYQQLLHEMDARLTTEAADVRRSLTVIDGNLQINEDIEWRENHHQYETGPPIYILVLNKDKTEYLRSGNIKFKQMPIENLHFLQNTTYTETINWNGQQIRFYTEAIHLATNHMGWIILGMPLEKIFLLLNILAKDYLILFPLCILLGIGGSIFIASKTLRPIQEITDKARLLNHHNLNEPLPVPNTHDEIAYLAITMNELLKRLRHNFYSIRQFTAHASHELKTPLSVLQLELEELEEKLSDISEVKLSPRISSEIFRIAKIIDDLSILAKADTEHIVLEKKEIWINDILFSEIERILPIAKESDITLKVGETISASILGDEYWIGIMMSNIIDNAIKYSPKHTTVLCGLDMQDSLIEFYVIDEGAGVSDDNISELTKRFYRAKVVTDIPGSGLGLAIVDWVVKNHGGTIRFFNQAPQGFKVSVRLPRLS